MINLLSRTTYCVEDWDTGDIIAVFKNEEERQKFVDNETHIRIEYQKGYGEYKARFMNNNPLTRVTLSYRDL